MQILKGSNSAGSLLPLVFALLVVISLGMAPHDASADRAVSTISLGSAPGALGVNYNTNMIYVTNPGSSTVSVIDGSTDSVVARIPVMSDQSGIAVDSIADKVYVSNPGSGSVTVIDGSTNSVADTITVPGGPTSIAANPNAGMIYVLQSSYHNIAVIDGVTDKVVYAIPYRSGYTIWTMGVGVNPSTDRFYLSWATNPNTHIDHYVDVYRGTTNSRIDTIAMPSVSSDLSSSGFAVDKEMDMIYLVANSFNNYLYSINGTSDRVTTGPQLRQDSGAIDVNPYTSKIYVANRDNNTLYVINGTTRSITNIIPVGISPVGVAVNPYTDRIYVANRGDSTVSVIQGILAPPQFTTSHLRVNSRGPSGNITTGFQAELYGKDGTLLYSGLTPHTFMLDNGQDYTVHVGGNATYQFDHWSDNSSTSPTRSVSISSDYAVIAVYRTFPQPPAGLSATLASSSEADLSWQAPSDNGGSAITGYEIERSADGGATWSTVVSSTGSQNTAYSDTGLLSGTTYTYRASAVNVVGPSQPSGTAVATPIVLHSVRSTSAASSSAITLSGFDAGQGSNRLLVVGISADNSPALSVAFGGVPLARAASSFYNDDSEWWYLAGPVGTGDIVVTMNGSASAVVGAYSFSGVDQADPVPTTSATHGNATQNIAVSIAAKYPTSWVLDLPSTYGVVALYDPTCAGMWSASVPNAVTGASSSEISASAGPVACSWAASQGDLWDDSAIEIKPAGLAQGPTSSAPAVLHLQVLSQDSSGNELAGYYTELYAQNGTQVDSGYTPYVFALDSGTAYTVRAEDYGSFKFGHWLDTGSADANRTMSITSDESITAVYVTIPAHPSNLTATAVSSSEIGLSWSAPSSDGGSPVTGYRIQSSADGTTWTTVSKNTGSTSTAYSDTGLSPDTTYYYRVFALNSAGSSYRSNIASATTPALTVAGINVGPAAVPLP